MSICLIHVKINAHWLLSLRLVGLVLWEQFCHLIPRGRAAVHQITGPDPGKVTIADFLLKQKPGIGKSFEK